MGGRRASAHRRGRVRRVNRPGGRAHRFVRALLGAVGTAVIVAGLVLFGARGYPTTRPHLLPGTAWLVSSQVGQVTLLDGSSAEVAAQVPVAPPGTGLTVVQQGSTAYAVNGTAGSVRRIDGATFAVSPAVVPIPEAGAGLDVFVGPDVLYALDTRRGVLTGADPRTLAARGGPVSLSAQVPAQAAAFDDAGRLWLLDNATGELIWVRDGQRHSRRGAVRPGAGMLVLAGGAPVLVDPAGRTAALLDPRTGAARGTTDLDLRPGDRIQVTGSAGAARLYVVAARGVLAICDLTAATCPTIVPLGGEGADLGAAVESAGRVFVPDYASGRVWVVDVGERRVVAQPKVLDRGTRFQLLSRDGVVFFNDPLSEHAGVIRLDGGVRPVAKYDPRHPDDSLPGAKAGGGPQPPNKDPNKDPKKDPKKPADQPKPPPPAGPPPPADPPPPPAEVRIVVSTGQPRVNEDIGLGLAVDRGPAPVKAHWDFGDGGTGDGTTVLHRWTAEGSYLVSVRAVFPDGHPAVASLTLDLTVRPPVFGTVAVTTGGTGTGVVDSQPAGLACPPSCRADYAVGDPVVLSAAAGGTSDFTGWGGACATAGTAPTCTLTVGAGTAQVSATFAAKPKLRIQVTSGGTVVGTGISCRSTCVTGMTTGQQLTLTAQPDPNFTFTGWGGDCAGSGSCLLTMDGDKVVTAAFKSLGPLPAPTGLNPPDRALITHTTRLEMVTVPVSWTPVPGADHYLLESEEVPFSPPGPPFEHVITPTTAPKGTVRLDCTFPTEGPLFQWRVTAIAADGTRGADSPWSRLFCGPPSM